MDRQMPAGVPPVPGPPPGQVGMIDAAMGKFNPAAAAPQAQGPDQAAQKAYTDALSGGQGDPMAAAKNAWKQAAQQAADPNTPDAPGSENLRKIQQHLVSTKGMDPLTAWAIAHEALPQVGQAPPAGGPPAPGR